jgi:hypothetical protein
MPENTRTQPGTEPYEFPDQLTPEQVEAWEKQEAQPLSEVDPDNAEAEDGLTEEYYAEAQEVDLEMGPEVDIALISAGLTPFEVIDYTEPYQEAPEQSPGN